MTSSIRTTTYAVLTCLVLATGCGDGSDGTGSALRSAAETSTTQSEGPAEPSATPSETRPEWTSGSIELGGSALSYRYDASRYREDRTVRLHLLPLEVVEDDQKERWADLFLFAPTLVFAPGTQRTMPLPADPVGWFRDRSGQRILRERTVSVMGQRATSFDVDRDGAELFGDGSGGAEGDGLERFVLWKVDGTWLLLQASTFRGQDGLLAPDRRGELVPQLLRDLARA